MVNKLFRLIAALATLRCIYACSNIFAYSDDYRSGTFAVDGSVGTTIETTIQLSIADILSQTNLGSLRTQNYDVFHVLSTTGKIYYVVQFPISHSVPRVMMITTNGRVVCNGEPYNSPQRTKVTLSHAYTSTLGSPSRFGNQHMPPSDPFYQDNNDVYSMSDENHFMPLPDNQVYPSYRPTTTPQSNFGLFLNVGDQTHRSNGGRPFVPRWPQTEDPIRRDQNGFYATIGGPPFDSFGNRESPPSDGVIYDNRPSIQQPNRNVGSNRRPSAGSNLEPTNGGSRGTPNFGRDNANEGPMFRPNLGTQNQPPNRQPSQPIDRPSIETTMPPSRSSSDCGTVVHGLSSHIYFGESIPYGSWPWLVPLFQAGAPDMKYLCGGTLVSPRAVITSAHCFDEANDLDAIYVVVGRFNLLEWTNKNSTIIKVTVKVHPHYRKADANFDADIAVLHLQEEAIINDYVRTACVWKRTILIDDIVNKSAVVAGWGQTEQGVYSTLPKQIVTKVVSNEECFKANSMLQSLTTGRNFCAGKLDGTGPCRGDSGGGLLINENGRWTLRGIVSAIINTGIRDCDLSNYVIYTDVAQFHDFLEGLI